MAEQRDPPVVTLELRDEQALALDRVVEQLAHFSEALGSALNIEWRDELTLRGRVLGLWPHGQTSGSGNCRIVAAADGWVALNVSRPWDRSVLPALVEGDVAEDPWTTLCAWSACRSEAEVVERARLFDLAAAQHATFPDTTPVPLRATRAWPAAAVRAVGTLTVVDLSALWAGPLVARLLMQCGASVTKVETSERPDAARETPDFYRHLHPTTQEAVTVDLRAADGRTRLRELIEGADVVIEGSRPRALEQLGCGPAQVEARPGRVWLSITGYGRREPGRHWIAFGDDAAFAGGLTTATPDGLPAFGGDAMADPITGLFGAAAILRSLNGGGGHLLDVSLAGAAAAIARGAESSAPVP